MARFEIQSGTRAMVVDDNDSVLLIVARWLLEVGCVVSTALTFEEGLSAIYTRCPDLLVLDVRLGEFNGLHLAIAARQRCADARIVLMSGWDDPVLRADARMIGASYLCKPFGRAQLLADIRNEVSRPSTRRRFAPAGASAHAPSM